MKDPKILLSSNWKVDNDKTDGYIGMRVVILLRYDADNKPYEISVCSQSENVEKPNWRNPEKPNYIWGNYFHGDTEINYPIIKLFNEKIKQHLGWNGGYSIMGITDKQKYNEAITEYKKLNDDLLREQFNIRRILGKSYQILKDEYNKELSTAYKRLCKMVEDYEKSFETDNPISEPLIEERTFIESLLVDEYSFTDMDEINHPEDYENNEDMFINWIIHCDKVNDDLLTK